LWEKLEGCITRKIREGKEFVDPAGGQKTVKFSKEMPSHGPGRGRIKATGNFAKEKKRRQGTLG